LTGAGELALNGGRPIRTRLLPYGRQLIDEQDVQAVEKVLRSEWLTTGPMVGEFEASFARAVGAAEAVVVNSGTAALHCSVHALRLRSGDEVIVPACTFAATATSVMMEGAVPVFADVDPDCLLLDPARVEERMSARTRAVIAVDYGGQPCRYDELRDLCRRRDIALIADACHALGARYRGQPVGTLADLTAFSLHPVKQITTGEGGVVTTDDAELAERMRRFRNHGISADHRQRNENVTWYYEVTELGMNYRLTDLQCALGLAQLSKLSGFLARCREIAARYDAAFASDAATGMAPVPLARRPDVEHAFHLYVVRVPARDWVFRALRAEGIGVNVHYIPVHLHPLFQRTLGTRSGLCPVTEEAYASLLSLPIFAAMSDTDVDDVLRAVRKVFPHIPAEG
jgi:perosamine synthetase